MNLAVNHLPVLTWNQLKLNEVNLEINDALRGQTEGGQQEERADGRDALPDGVTVSRQVGGEALQKRFEMLGICNPGEKIVAGKLPIYNRQRFATGMGQDVDRLMQEMEIHADVYTVDGSYVCETPIELLYCYNRPGSGLSRMFIHAKAGSESTFVICFRSEEGSKGAADDKTDDVHITEGAGIQQDIEGNTVRQEDGQLLLVGAQTYLYVEQGAKLHLHIVQMLGSEYTFFHDIGGVSCDDSALTLTKLDLGASKVYEGFNELQTGDRCTFCVDFGYVGLPGSFMDINYNDVFLGKKADGRMYFKEALLGDAQKTFRGTIDFRQASTGSKGDEQEDILLLGEDVVNKTIPLILCEEEDVDGRHAATIGSLSEEMLFYMQARGIGRREAEELMVRASIGRISRMIPSKSVADAVMAYIGTVFAESE